MVEQKKVPSRREKARKEEKRHIDFLNSICIVVKAKIS